jgi:hypothetical protein
LLITCHLKLFAPHLGIDDWPINPDHFETCFLHAPENTAWPGQLSLSDGMRRPVSDGMLYAPKLSTRFEAQEIKETGNEKD